MKKYIQPKITVVNLDSEQAILQVCKIGGAYGSINTQTICRPLIGVGAIPIGACPVSVKGVRNIFFIGGEVESELGALGS
ncbi:MAG: hypothetical protein PHQ52_07090 [Candidatus Omnitrophica bacterium]|nr:hypothetical protein [Candidatus Omnitrophota bacterium]